MMIRRAANRTSFPNASHVLIALLLTGCAQLSLGPVRAQTYSVTVEQHPEVGTLLAGPTGLTLYAHEGETIDNIVCSGPCLSDWAPYLLEPGEEAEAPPEVVEQGGTLTTFVRQGNQLQLAYNGMPLYYFKEDRIRGEALGNGHGGSSFAVAVGPTFRVAEHPTFGRILVGPNGMTLYTFERDQGDQYECAEGCAQHFPPLVVTGPVHAPPGLEAAADKFERDPDDFHAARQQVRFKGKPLYYFSRDEQPGDVRGHGIAGLWTVAQP